MIVPEYLAKSYLARYGLLIPRGRMAETALHAQTIAQELGGPVVVKAQIASGKRGKSGGILFAVSPEQAAQAAAQLLDRELLGYRVQQVLVEEKLALVRELYAGLILDRASGTFRLILTLEGGMDVEELPPEAVKTLSLTPGELLPIHRVARFLQASAVEETLVQPLAFVIATLHRVFVDLDLIQIEINPLALLADGRLAALDCKMEVDDNALSRHPDFARLHRQSLGAREQKAAELGVSFVPLDGDVGVIASGAGLGMATLDLLRRAGLAPADFLDTGGAISVDLVRESVRLVMDTPSARGLMVNLYGGINPMIAAANGIVEGLKGLPPKPVVVKLLGNSQEEAWKILEEAGVTVVKVPQTETAVQTLAALLNA